MKKLKAVTTIIGIIGVIVLIGTAGAGDLGTITIKQMLCQGAVGIGCLAIAGLGQRLEVE